MGRARFAGRSRRVLAGCLLAAMVALGGSAVAAGAGQGQVVQPVAGIRWDAQQQGPQTAPQGGYSQGGAPGLNNAAGIRWS